MMNKNIFWQSKSLFLLFLLTIYSVADATESQNKKSSVFDGIQGVQGELSLESQQAIYQWKNNPSVALSAESSGFAFRQFEANFIFSVELKVQPQTGRRVNFGVEVRSVSGETLIAKTKIDGQGNLVVEVNQGQHRQTTALVAVKNPNVFQIERKDNELIFSAARFGNPWQIIARYSIVPKQVLVVGVYRQFQPADVSVLELRNVRWVIPAWPGFVPYYDYLGSRLELLDVDTGLREIIYETSAGIEAPNWMMDGDNILYNSSGRIYKLHLPSKKVAFIDTGFGLKNNNDHIISFNGKWLGISHHAKKYAGASIIYKLPISGGEALQLTFKAPSYLHGWSPDGQHILYTGKRDGRFSIYRTTTDGAGEETQLTTTNGLDDGPEYSPDGKTIYFNSSRSGVMQLWRMDADGKNPKQITHDHFNNWFPHISPDGKTIIFLSYLPDVSAKSHPYYRQVYLRTMPIAGGEPKVVAYLYGGQGTINVPSWSPDGKRVAFVSNSVTLSEKP
jgi:TolB protein